MAGLVWSIISSLLGNVVLHDDAVKDIMCGLVVVFCGSVNMEGEGICGVWVARVFQFSGI